MGRKAIDLTGHVYGRLKVVKFIKKVGSTALWECECTCGKVTQVFRGNLRSGSTVSCGCLSVEKLVERSTTHGMAHTREFSIWHGMKNRCFNPNSDCFQLYGGRGITVCEDWANSFEQFYKDMGKCPDNHSIERIDVNGHYCPTNCKWATVDEQNNNKRTNVKITINGEELTMAQWSKRLGYTSPVIQQRRRRGWNMVEAVTSLKHR